MDRVSDDQELVGFRADADLVADLDALADAANTSRSDLLRKAAHLVIETQSDRLERQGELQERERQQVEANRKRRNIIRFPNTIRDLFLEDLKADVPAAKLPRLAESYREQARTKEELAQELDPDDPVVEPGELVGAVDRELSHAVEAADVSNWYDQHRNPYAADLSGVRDGIEEREDLVALLAGLVDTHASLARAFANPDEVPPIDAADLPRMATTLLPDGVTDQDVADLATQLARQGLTGEQVRDLLDGQPFDPDAIEVDATVEPAEDADVAQVLRGGQALNAADEPGDDTPTVTASNSTQAELMDAITAADGGRTPSARRSGWNQPEEVDTETDMSHNDTEPDHDSTDSEDVSEQLDTLTQATREAAQQAGGEADE